MRILGLLLMLVLHPILFSTEIEDMQIIAKFQKISGKFEQKKTLKDVDITLTSRGVFSIDSKSGMEWNTTFPMKNKLTVTRSSIAVVAENSTSKIDLSNNKIAQKFLNIFFDVAIGNFDKIKNEFDIAIDKEEITLYPKDDTLKTMINRIKLRLKNRIISEIEISSKNDDALIIFSDVVVDA